MKKKLLALLVGFVWYVQLLAAAAVQVLQEVLKVRQPVAQMRRLMPDRQISRRIKALPAKRNSDLYMWAADAEQEFDKAIVAQYEKEHPDIDIEENYIPYAEYLSKINTMAAAGSMPDIFNLPEGNVLSGEKRVRCWI